MPTIRRTRTTVLLSLLTLFFALVAGCANHEQASDPSGPHPTGAPAAFPLLLTAPDGQTLTLQHQPRHIVSLSPSSTETLFAIGAGKQVAAVDSLSDFPANAPRTKLSSLTPNVEAITNYHPDLVVASADTGKLTENLGKLHVPVLVLPAATTLQGAFDQMILLGKATGHAPEATKLATDTTNQIQAVVSGVTKPKQPLTYYHELDQTYFSVTSKTFIGQVYSLFGLVNIADKAPAAGGYPQLSAEAVSSANPDLVFLADTKCCGQNAQSVAKRPGWSELTAVKSGNVVALDDDIASRWGPRVLDFVKAVGAAVDKAAKQTGA